MKVLNGKRSALVFQLDNGQTLRVQPGEFSNPFIGTVALIRAIISSGTPKQVGFVVSNSYEMNIVKDIAAAGPYYHATEDEAKASILEGKDFTQAKTEDPNERKIKELEDQLAQSKKEYEELKLEFSKSSGVSQEDFLNLKKQLGDAASEYSALKTRKESLENQVEEMNTKINDLKAKCEDLQTRYEKSSSDLLEANNKLKAQVEAAPVVQKNADGQTLEEVTDLFKKLQAQIPVEVKKYTDKIEDLTAENEALKSNANSISNEEVEALKTKNATLVKTLEDYVPKTELEALKAEAKSVIDSKDAEITALKADGAKVFENYTKAKNAVQEIMAKFGISYVDGEYKMTVNQPAQ